MIAVIFEVELAEGAEAGYLQVAADLRPLLAQIEGFISIERFQSLTQPNKLLSLSFWEDEEAVKRWRTLAEHRQAQDQGRAGLFAGYRLRVAGVIRDYGMADRDGVPADSLERQGQAFSKMPGGG